MTREGRRGDDMIVLEMRGLATLPEDPLQGIDDMCSLSKLKVQGEPVPYAHTKETRSSVSAKKGKSLCHITAISLSYHCHITVIHCHTLSYTAISLPYTVISLSYHCHTLPYTVIHCHTLAYHCHITVIAKKGKGSGGSHAHHADRPRALAPRLASSQPDLTVLAPLYPPSPPSSSPPLLYLTSFASSLKADE